MDAKPKPRRRVKRPDKGSLVMVYWSDAGDHESVWKSGEALKPQDMRMVTIGIYLGEQKHEGVNHVMLAGTKSLSDEQYNTCSQVPTGIVTRIVELIEKPEA
jgi:hypothetical protein